MDKNLVTEERPGSRRIERRVCALVAANLRVEYDQVSLSSTFKELGADNLDFYSILTDVETVFGISIPDREALRMVNVRHLVALLDEYFRRNELQTLQSNKPA